MLSPSEKKRDVLEMCMFQTLCTWAFTNDIWLFNGVEQAISPPNRAIELSEKCAVQQPKAIKLFRIVWIVSWRIYVVVCWLHSLTSESLQTGQDQITY